MPPLAPILGAPLWGSILSVTAKSNIEPQTVADQHRQDHGIYGIGRRPLETGYGKNNLAHFFHNTFPMAPAGKPPAAPSGTFGRPQDDNLRANIRLRQPPSLKLPPPLRQAMADTMAVKRLRRTKWLDKHSQTNRDPASVFQQLWRARAGRSTRLTRHPIKFFRVSPFVAQRKRKGPFVSYNRAGHVNIHGFCVAGYFRLCEPP